ncbi:MAG TPA: THUMP domain-containing protein [Candidatus Binatia bacterium]|nr:THUMP domain-containing protein [Candidatus Binatia bacterium]
MHHTILIRYAEIGIKGKNRSMFENKLVDNIRACLKSQGITADIERRFGRILVRASAMPDLSKVFGIASYSAAINAGKTLASLQDAVTPVLPGIKGKTFRVTCSRLDKQFTLSSNEIARGLGAFVQQQTGAKVSLETFDKEIVVEIIHGALYVLTETIAGPGGLPVGIEGTVLALIDSKRAEDAALLLMKRGCTIVALVPEKRTLTVLPKYACGIALRIIEAKDIDVIAEKVGAKAVVVGDTLKELNQYETTLQVLRPLVGGVA